MYDPLSDSLGVIIKNAPSNKGGFVAEIYGGSQDGKRIGGVYYEGGRIYEEWSIPQIPTQSRQIKERDPEKINLALRNTLMTRLDNINIFEARENHLLVQVRV